MRLIALYDNEEVSEGHSRGLAGTRRGSVFFALPQPCLTGEKFHTPVEKAGICLHPYGTWPRQGWEALVWQGAALLALGSTLSLLWPPWCCGAVLMVILGR